MHRLPDEGLASLLDDAPVAEAAIVELFERAWNVSESRLFLSVLDVERLSLNIDGEQRNHLGINYARGWIASQVGQLYALCSEVPEGSTEEDENWIRYLQLLSYSQLWECLAIQRLVWSIVRTAGGKEYDPRLLIESDPPTANIWRSIRDGCAETGLSLAAVLDATYHNLIRNSFSHSDAWVTHGAISTAPDTTTRGPTFYIKFQTWDRLFTAVGTFLKTLFRERKKVVRELKARSPFSFALPEFNTEFTVKFDEKRKRWEFLR